MPPPTPRQELAAAAYAHACAVLGPTDAATEAAILAVRRGGRSLATVLGHARDAALARASSAATTDSAAPAPRDLDELALRLAFLRPATERAVVDLDARYGLDQSSLGQALGMAPAAAASRAAEVAAEWQRVLDPVLLANLGPGSCDDLAAVLGDPAPAPAGDASDADVAPERPLVALLTAGERVAAHLDACDACRDRLRAMVSVRTLFTQRPLAPAPAPVLDAAAVARLRAATMPPPLERVRTAARGRLPVLAAVTVVVVGAVAGGAFLASSDNEPASQLEAMTKLPAASNALAVRPGAVDASAGPTVRLRNLRDSATSWTAIADQPWVVVEPAHGELDPHGTASVRIALAPTAPEGSLRAAVTFTGGDGSTAVARVLSTVARPPDIATERQDCQVTASVEDDSEVSSVVLHQRNAPPIPMRETDTEGAYSATLASSGGDWWVTAVDAIGNEGRTADQPLAGGC